VTRAPVPARPDVRQARASFACFGGRCAVIVAGEGDWGTATDAVDVARDRLLTWHERFTRFDSASELSHLNADPRPKVPVSPLMARFVATAVKAAQESNGLVDPTLLHELEAAGYRRDLGMSLPLTLALSISPRRRAGSASPESRWREVRVDLEAGTVTRPPGVAFDSGGIAKGLFADVLAEALGSHATFGVDCAGDLRLGGAAGTPRPVHIASPFDGSTLHSFALADAGIATSGIGRRSWLGADGRPAHHLLDPSTGRPAYTGIVQVTALAGTAVQAEIRSKAALLSGPDGAAAWLPDGGVIVFDGGDHEVVPGPLIT